MDGWVHESAGSANSLEWSPREVQGNARLPQLMAFSNEDQLERVHAVPVGRRISSKEHMRVSRGRVSSRFQENINLSMLIPVQSPLVEDRPTDSRTHFGSRFVLTKSNPLRFLWTIAVTLLLVYTGTVFMYRLCFIEFRIPTESEVAAPHEASALDTNASDAEDWAALDTVSNMSAPDEANAPPTTPSDAADWAALDNVINILFWIDLGANFFFTYDEEEAYEVDDIRLIAKNYFKTYFLINLVACIPDAFIEWAIQSYANVAPQSLNQGVRALRLQRISRLARLTRLSRLAKLRQQRQTALYQWLERQKGIRVITMMIGLLWVMHFVACGWYLCASLHDSPQDTWVSRRITDPDGTATLVESPPFDQWICAMYFVLTVFTTVGFGDISAVTIGEIFYVCFTMGVGAVVHSIIISEVINVVVSTDDVQVFIKKQSELVQAFAEHTEIEFDISRKLRRWVDNSAKQWAAENYDRNEMKEVLTGKFLPRELLEQLPSALFSGKLLRNNFLWVCKGLCNMPSRLPVLVALALSKSTFTGMEVIYHVHDYSFNMFLVEEGTFAYVARPSRTGGIAEVPADLSRSELLWGAKRGRRSAFKKAMVQIATLTKNFKTEAEDMPEMTLFPYVLFGRNSYFGDEGLARALPRAQTARCESEHGELLSLSKVDMRDLGDQFPQFGARWAYLARRHELRHQAKLSSLTFGCTYRHFAAVQIQNWFRECMTALPCSTEPDRDFVEIVTDATIHLKARKAASSQLGLVALQRDLDSLTGIVGGLAERVDSLLSHLKRKKEKRCIGIVL